MTTRPAWSLDALIQLMMGVLVCLSLGVIINHLALSKEELATSEGRFFGFMIQTSVLHLGTFLCIGHFLRLHQSNWGNGFGLTHIGIRKTAGLAIGAALIATPIAMVLQQLVAHAMMSVNVEPRAQEVVKTLEQTIHWGQQLYFAFVALVMAPVIEELIFRGILYPAIRQRGCPRAALWISALLFAFTHANVMTFIPLTFLALVLTWLYERTGNILAPIVAHGTFNGINFFLVIYQHELIDKLRAWQ